MVDFDPWSGNYDGTVVRQNNIVGGLATSSPTSPQDTTGTNNNDAIIKSVYCSTCLTDNKLIDMLFRIGIAMGPRVWFGNRTHGDVNHGGTVLDNRFEGAVSVAFHEHPSFALLIVLTTGSLVMRWPSRLLSISLFRIISSSVIRPSLGLRDLIALLPILRPCLSLSLYNKTT